MSILICKNLAYFLNAYKVSLNMKKTELVIFKQQMKKNSPTKLKLSYNRLYSSESVKYLNIKFDDNLNWKQHFHDIAINQIAPMSYFLQLETC